METIVTKESLESMLENPNRKFVETVVGRALVVLFNRQTESEKATSTTKENNNIGFTGFDAKSGSITAKYYLKHKRLEDWQIEKWTKTMKGGYPKLCSYHRQLNEAANLKKGVTA